MQGATFQAQVGPSICQQCQSVSRPMDCSYVHGPGLQGGAGPIDVAPELQKGLNARCLVGASCQRQQRLSIPLPLWQRHCDTHFGQHLRRDLAPGLA